jgi:hypothetical protein
LAHPCSLLAQLLLGRVGWLDILDDLGIKRVAPNASLAHGVLNTSGMLGVSLRSPYAPFHVMLRLMSFNQALSARPAMPTLMVGYSSRGPVL